MYFIPLKSILLRFVAASDGNIYEFYYYSNPIYVLCHFCGFAFVWKPNWRVSFRNWINKYENWLVVRASIQFMFAARLCFRKSILLFCAPSFTARFRIRFWWNNYAINELLRVCLCVTMWSFMACILLRNDFALALRKPIKLIWKEKKRENNMK